MCGDTTLRLFVSFTLLTFRVIRPRALQLAPEQLEAGSLICVQSLAIKDTGGRNREAEWEVRPATEKLVRLACCVCEERRFFCASGFRGVFLWRIENSGGHFVTLVLVFHRLNIGLSCVLREFSVNLFFFPDHLSSSDVCGKKLKGPSAILQHGLLSLCWIWLLKRTTEYSPGFSSLFRAVHLCLEHFKHTLHQLEQFFFSKNCGWFFYIECFSNCVMFVLVAALKTILCHLFQYILLLWLYCEKYSAYRWETRNVWFNYSHLAK